MRHHDFHLEGYEVSDHGKKILLRLHSSLDNPKPETSLSRFSDVAMYDFEHTDGAIITNIKEVELGKTLAESEVMFRAQAAQSGLRDWKADFSGYKRYLEDAGYKAWHIDSAIGFSGLVIAREAVQLGRITGEWNMRPAGAGPHRRCATSRPLALTVIP
ncbi:MAG: hypothetical protein ACI9DC_001155 [Gammaproteobacteria bacterium]|jgi:hypothetical protein